VLKNKQRTRLKGIKMNFKELFKQIPSEDIGEKFNIFTLVGKDYYAVTAGKKEHYNSMIGSGGGFGLFFKKPTTWCLFRKDRYTLELIEKEQTYTLSFFPNEYKEQMLFLGRESGRDSKKMKEVNLTSIQTPSVDMTFKEAKLIIECRLTAITTPNPDDFYSQESRDYIDEAYKDANEFRKLVFGEITNVWIKK
jgi:flavin reductase (DIM6/NTAB) family NADH-FMN oxidoreductase RutF